MKKWARLELPGGFVKHIVYPTEHFTPVIFLPIPQKLAMLLKIAEPSEVDFVTVRFDYLYEDKDANVLVYGNAEVDK